MKTTTIKIKDLAGEFAENKELAKQLRETILFPAVDRGELIVLDFGGVSGVTQSFVHALTSAVLQQYGEKILDQFEFKNCQAGVRSVVLTVVEYSLIPARKIA